ncbi:MAG: hypothetical protein ABSB26_09300 [Nitrososphaerales archaeon]|jgi:hypothetical protein
MNVNGTTIIRKKRKQKHLKDDLLQSMMAQSRSAGFAAGYRLFDLDYDHLAEVQDADSGDAVPSEPASASRQPILRVTGGVA